DGYTKALLACRPTLETRAPRLLVLDDHIAGRSGAASAKAKDANARIILEAADITKSFWIRSGVFGRKAFQAVRGASFRLRACHTLRLARESGSSTKTTRLDLSAL